MKYHFIRELFLVLIKGPSIEYLLTKADFAMYKAKQLGGNQVSVAP